MSVFHRHHCSFCYQNQLFLLPPLQFRILQWWQKDVVHLSWWNQIELVQYQQLRSDTERGGRKGNNRLIKKAIGILNKLTPSGCISISSTTTAVKQHTKQKIKKNSVRQINWGYRYVLTFCIIQKIICVKLIIYFFEQSNFNGNLNFLFF